MRRSVAILSVCGLVVSLSAPRVTIASADAVPTPQVVELNDAEGPVGSVAINGGDILTTSLDVILSVPAADPDGVASVMLSGPDCGDWTVRDYDETQPWTLTGPTGYKSVCVRWVDTLGNVSGGNYFDTIKYDPNGSDVHADDATATGLLKDTIKRIQVKAVDRSPYTTTNFITFSVDDPTHGSASVPGPMECFAEWGMVEGEPVLGKACTTWVEFIPDSGFIGTETFGYTATDVEGLSDSGTISLTYAADSTPPTGTIAVYSTTLAAATGYTNTTSLLVRISAVDSQSALATLRLSNSPMTVNGKLRRYTSFANPGTGWNELVPWSMANATGGSTAAGSHTIYAQWSDVAGNWSTVKTSKIILDKTVPVVSSVTIGFATTAPQAGVPIRISFTTSETGYYEMQRSVDGGAWTAMHYNISSKRLDMGHATGHSYRYRVRMEDGATNLSAWKYSITFKPAYYTQTSGSVRYSGSWTKVTYVGAGWITARSRTYGNYAKFTFTGKGVSWQAIKGPSRGKAQIYIDGALVKTVDLYSSKFSSAFAYSRTWATSGSHSIRIRVLGTSGRPYVDIDGFGVLK